MEKVRKMKSERAPLNPPAVCFKSCNFDTYIAKMGEYFLISTCHNHPWDLRSIESACPSEFNVYFGEEYFDELPRSIPFYHLEYDLVGRKPEWRVYGFTYCQEPSCYSDLWVIEGKIICPKCGKTPKKKS